MSDAMTESTTCPEGHPTPAQTPGAPCVRIRTATRVDTGGWFGKAPLWLELGGDTLRAVAAGRRPYVEAVPRDAMGESVYCHVTGALVLAPAPGMRATRLRLSPVEARRLLAWMNGKEIDDA